MTVTITHAQLDEPLPASRVQLTLSVSCEDEAFEGGLKAHDVARAFVARAQLLAQTPLGHGDLATDSDGYLLSRATLAYLIHQAELRGAENGKRPRAPRPPKKTKKAAKRRR